MAKLSIASIHQLPRPRLLLVLASFLIISGAGVLGTHQLSSRQAGASKPGPQLSASTLSATITPSPIPTATPSPSPTPTPKTGTAKSTKPKTTTAPSTAIGGSGQQFGISPGGGLAYLGDHDLAVRLDRIKQTGVQWLRIDIDWSTIQAAGSSSYNWGPYDRVVDGARARGIKVLGILTYTPGWARSNQCPDTNKCRPANASTFANFAATATTHYAARGVHTWEVWNEPNYHSSWQPSPNINDYAELLRAAYPAIKQADRTALVLSGGLAAMTVTADGDYSGPDFLNGLYSLGLKDSFDAVAFHPYSFPALPGAYGIQNAWSQMSQTPVNLRQIMINRGDSAKKIWATEVGAPTNGPGSSADGTGYNTSFATDHVSEALQANIVQNSLKLWASYSWGGPIFWLTDTDEGTATDSTENFYGLVRADSSAKPAYSAFVQTIASLK